MKKILVVKIGRSIATSKRNKLDSYRFEQLSKQIKKLAKYDISVVLVVSAGVCYGEYELGLKQNYTMLKQLIGGVGQASVIADIYKIFKKHSITIGQLLLTKQDIEKKEKRQTIQSVIQQAAEQNIVLIVNENDIVELHSFEGNDYLATEIAKLVKAKYLLYLTDVAGVLNGRMQVIKQYSNSEGLADIRNINYKGEVGGMKGKIDAAVKAAKSGIITWIADGKTENVLTRMFLHNEHIGTKIHI